MTSGRAVFQIAVVCMAVLILVLPVDAWQSGTSDSQDEHLPLLIDTDMALDDVRALFALLACPHLDIHGIITVEGSASPGKGTDNLIGLLESNHVETISICRGCAASHLEPPHWREVANNLGGAAFPPPRELSPSTDAAAWLDEILEKQDGKLHYLALGPLGNLSRLEQKHPGGLARVKRLWVPVKIDQEKRVKGWNLSYDELSTREVLTVAPDIVLVDLSVFEGLNAREFLTGIKRMSPVKRWIDRWLALKGDMMGHLMLSDELAAAAFVKPGLMEVGAETFALNSEAGEDLEIVPRGDGNIRIARFKFPGASLEHLQDILGWPPRSRHGPETESKIPASELLRAFHGHLGPYVVLGYRMGKLALETAHSEGHFGISAVVHSPLQPPPSCLIDGLQIGSGCTLGKRNIEVRELDGPAFAVFTPQHGNKVTVRLRPEIPELIKQLVDEKGVEAAGEDLLERKINTLFILEITFDRNGSEED